MHYIISHIGLPFYLYLKWNTLVIMLHITNLESNGERYHFFLPNQYITLPYCPMDPCHKWLPIIYSFVSIKIGLTSLIFELIIQKKFYSQTN